MVFRKAITVVILAVVCRYLYLFLVEFGVGVHYNAHFPGNCRIIPGVECGSEQISVTKRNPGLAFITSGQKIFTRCSIDLIEGKIFMFDFEKPEEGARKLTLESEAPLSLEDFGPHGMDILEHDDGTIDLYIVNHAKHVETVEVFRYTPQNPGSLKHLRTIRDELFACINDITLLGDDHFYITEWVKYCELPTIFVAAEFLLKLNTGSIIYYDHGKSKVAATGPSFNGITQSLDKKEVVVVAGSTTFLHIYHKLEDGELKFKEKINVGHFGDNVFTDDLTGDYYLGVQKKGLRLLSAAKNKTNAAVPSSAVRVFKTLSDEYAVEEVMHDTGRLHIQCVSAAVHYKGHYLFGSIYDKMLYCNSNV